jgi:precorrin-2 dehydrogenase/sirohydrochlorin ferrochelatase
LSLYPAMLRLTGRRCVVVGGGTVAARKVDRLLAAGASVTVVAPTVGPELATKASDGSIRWEQRQYRVGDLAGATLAFSATDSREVNAAVGQEAEQANVPVNLADDPVASTLQIPAVLEREDLSIAISTGGRSPAFARRLREDLERVLSPERLALLELYAELRDELRATGHSTGQANWEAADDRVLELLRSGQRREARRTLREQVRGSAVEA